MTQGTDAKEREPEGMDGRKLWEAGTKYTPEFRKQQRQEGCYLFVLMAIAVLLLAFLEFGGLQCLATNLMNSCPGLQTPTRYLLLGLGGLLGGTVFGAKWLYHAVAKGMWHEDRRLWRFLSPWISVGATIGVGALLDAGFFRQGQTGDTATSGSALIGTGFILGYLTDRALAKMADLTEVLFGETKQRFDPRRQNPPPG